MPGAKSADRAARAFEWIFWLAGLIALLVSIVLALHLLVSRPLGHDLSAYVMAAHRLIHHQPLYPTGGVVLGPFGLFFYPPVVALLFVPFALRPDVAAPLWHAVLVVVAGATCWSLVRDLPRAAKPWAIAAFFVFHPLIWELQLGNVTLLCLAVSLVAWHIRHRAYAGALFAGALLLKPLPLIVLLFTSAAGHARVAGWTAASLAAAVIVTWPWLGGAWLDYTGLLIAVARADAATGPNIVPGAFGEGTLRLAAAGTAAGIAVFAATVARAAPARSTHAFRLALAAAPLVSTTIWYPYLVFALPLLLTDTPLRGLASLVARAARPIIWLILQARLVGEPGRDFTLPFAGLWLLLALGTIELVIAVRDPARAAGYGPTAPAVRGADLVTGR